MQTKWILFLSLFTLAFSLRCVLYDNSTIISVNQTNIAVNETIQAIQLQDHKDVTFLSAHESNEYANLTECTEHDLLNNASVVFVITNITNLENMHFDNPMVSQWISFLKNYQPLCGDNTHGALTSTVGILCQAWTASEQARNASMSIMYPRSDDPTLPPPGPIQFENSTFLRWYVSPFASNAVGFMKKQISPIILRCQL